MREDISAVYLKVVQKDLNFTLEPTIFVIGFPTSRHVWVACLKDFLQVWGREG